MRGDCPDAGQFFVVSVHRIATSCRTCIFEKISRTLTPIKAAFAPEEAKRGRKSRRDIYGTVVQDKGYPKLVDPKGRKIEHAVILKLVTTNTKLPVSGVPPLWAARQPREAAKT